MSWACACLNQTLRFFGALKLLKKDKKEEEVSGIIVDFTEILGWLYWKIIGSSDIEIQHTEVRFPSRAKPTRITVNTECICKSLQRNGLSCGHVSLLHWSRLLGSGALPKYWIERFSRNRRLIATAMPRFLEISRQLSTDLVRSNFKWRDPIECQTSTRTSHIIHNFIQYTRSVVRLPLSLPGFHPCEIFHLIVTSQKTKVKLALS